MKPQLTSLTLMMLFFFVKEANAQTDKWTSFPDTAVWNNYTGKTISVDELREKANGKRILVYYYQHFSIQTNNFNMKVLGDTAVTNFILANFYPIAVDLDIDKMKPDEPDVDRSKTYRKFLEEQAYYIKETPAFSVYNHAGILRGSKSFIRVDKSTKDAVLEFLQKRLK